MLANPCCCNTDEPCDGVCVIHSDKFDRADSGTVGTGWTENAGAWEIKDNTLYTQSSNARASWEPDPPNSIGDGQVVVARFKGGDTGDEVIVWYASDIYIKLTIGIGGLVEMYDGAALQLYECTADMVEDEWHTLKIVGSNANDYFTAVFIDDVCILSVARPRLDPIDEISCATGSVTDHVAFDFVCINKSDLQLAGCPEGLLRPWIKDDAVTELEITIAGAINNGVIDYTPLNGTYIVPFNDQFGGVLSIPSVTLGANTVTHIAFEVYAGGFSIGTAWWEIGCGFQVSSGGAYAAVYLQAYGNDAVTPVGQGTNPIQNGICGDTVTLQPLAANPDIGNATLSY